MEWKIYFPISFTDFSFNCAFCGLFLAPEFVAARSSERRRPNQPFQGTSTMTGDSRHSEVTARQRGAIATQSTRAKEKEFSTGSTRVRINARAVCRGC